MTNRQSPVSDELSTSEAVLLLVSLGTLALIILGILIY